MSIPTTETKPDGLQSLPPKQRRSLRKAIGNASTHEKNDLLRGIARHSLPGMQYYWQLLICLFLLVIGTLVGSNLVFLAGIIAIPLANPQLSLVYAGALPSARHFAHALIGIILSIGGFFLAGWIVREAAPLQMDYYFSGMGLADVSGTGLIWALLVITAILTAYWFTYHEALSRLSSILLGYLVLMPFFAAGQAVSADAAASNLPWVMIGLTRLSLVLLVMLLTTWVLGFPPRKSFGIVIAAVVFTLAAVSVVEIVNLEQNPILVETPEPTLIAPTSTPVTRTATSPLPTITATVLPSPTAEQISTPEPGAVVSDDVFARVTAPNGLVVRETPSTSARALTYVNFGETVQLTGSKETIEGIEWEQVAAPNGVVGWVSARFLETINP